MLLPDATRQLRDLIRQELDRSGVPLPVIRDTNQNPVTSPAVITRTGAATWEVYYKAQTALTPDASTPAWTRTAVGGVVTEVH